MKRYQDILHDVLDVGRLSKSKLISDGATYDRRDFNEQFPVCRGIASLGGTHQCSKRLIGSQGHFFILTARTRRQYCNLFCRLNELTRTGILTCGVHPSVKISAIIGRFRSM
jgi:hypothetical protein